ncbi:flagellar biosynthesis protein FliQ [Chromobacterium subtsugae]|uniref:Flagellar biosynthetic protein FliQ n=2 Tax=Chromobacterium TaxID=535 RepID=A0A344UEJ8_9NEIS|nr:MULTISPECIES: flagellar biosynthesis protein FliQ [Chromobacterium]AXE32358.1 flagellar biosynthetic protein FliQ [Chromobacterium phragmitis]AXE33696.1 flagellar biosynthetic protein FliQ [Chromobacterium phragmitis]KUM03342.1 flagellar biosynthetic protein FliQ [Chromobacterium subtsugae]KZE85936.1 flagellar biosynthetic protein FliQ [Chromobacterium sp. F49]MBW7567308.1 flagellar biosynthesis protein FliQ [Chromobacterium subtsugae]
MLTPDIAVDIVNDSLRVVVTLVTLLVLPSLIVGVVVSLIQAATQINEQTLSFLPRLLIVLLTIALAGHWITGYLMDFCVAMFQRAASQVG